MRGRDDADQGLKSLVGQAKVTLYFDEAEYADRIAILDRGKVVATGTPGEHKRAVGADTVALVTADDSLAAGRLVTPATDGWRPACRVRRGVPHARGQRLREARIAAPTGP